MAELLVKATNATNPNQAEDQAGCYKRGMPVLVRPDGHTWGALEGLPRFAIVKIPLIAVATVEKYALPYLDGSNHLVRRRLWQIRWVDLPAGAQNTLQTTGQLVIKATAAYGGVFDYTWAQVKGFFRNLETGLDETEDLS
jgi:hypothetical protein